MSRYVIRRRDGRRQSNKPRRSSNSYIPFYEYDAIYPAPVYTSTEVFEDEGKDDPDFTGLYGPDGQPIYYYKEYVPIGFHHRYDDYGNLVED